jgi:hypothetical protein
VEAARNWAGRTEPADGLAFDPNRLPKICTILLKKLEDQNAMYSLSRRYSVGATDFHAYLFPLQKRAKYFTTDAVNSL